MIWSSVDPPLSIGQSDGHTRPSSNHPMNIIFTAFFIRPLETFPIFKSSTSTTVASLHYERPPRGIAPERVNANSSGPRLTRHGTCVNHACPPSLSFTLAREPSTGDYFPQWSCHPSPIHNSRCIISSKNLVVHRSPKPKANRLGKIALQSPYFWWLMTTISHERDKRVLVAYKFHELICFRKQKEKHDQDMNQVQGYF